MSKERMKVIENILDEVKKHKNDNGEVECYPSYDQEALKLVDDGHVDWLYERVQELERANKQLKNNLSVYKNYYNNTLKHNKELIEQVQELEGKIVSFEVWYMLSEQQNNRYREAIILALQAQKEHGLSAGLVIKCMTQELEEVLEQNI